MCRDILCNLTRRHLVESHLTAEQPEAREALKELEAAGEPCTHRKAVIALKQQQKVAARHPRHPIVCANLVHVWQREHRVVRAAQPAEPLAVVASAVVIHNDLDARPAERAARAAS